MLYTIFVDKKIVALILLWEFVKFVCIKAFFVLLFFKLIVICVAEDNGVMKKVDYSRYPNSIWRSYVVY